MRRVRRDALSPELRTDLQGRVRVTLASEVAIGDVVESDSGERRRVARIERTHQEVILFDEAGECLIVGNKCLVTLVERKGRVGA